MSRRGQTTKTKGLGDSVPTDCVRKDDGQWVFLRSAVLVMVLQRRRRRERERKRESTESWGDGLSL